MSSALPNQIPMQQAANPVAQTTDPLAGLRDIHMPEAIGWWPLAPGWWILAALTFVLVAALLYYRHWRAIQQNRPTVFSTQQIMHVALLELAAMKQRHSEHENITSDHVRQAVADISQLLRRCSVQLVRLQHESELVAGLTGDAWLNWLDHQWDRDDFTQGAGRTLTEAPYRKFQSDTSNDTLQELFSLCQAWLEQQ